jgi:hypothetical protein
MKYLILLPLLLAACSSVPSRPYAEKGEPNLFVELNFEDGAFSVDTAKIFFFEEMPNCRRKYLGELKVPNGVTSSYTLPTDRELLLELGRASGNFFTGEGQHVNEWVRVFVKPQLLYKISYKERNGSRASGFFAKNKKGGEFKPLPGLPDRECEKLEMIWK